MISTLRTWAVAFLALMAAERIRAQPDNKSREIDRREEELVRRTVERAQRPIETERDKMLDELVKIPGPALPKDNFDPWFDSLAAGADTWKVDGNAPKTFREMHSRIAKQCGAKDSITREQFRRYASVNLTEKNSPPWRPPENTPEQDAERAFREADKDRTRRMEANEMSEVLQGQWKKWDRDNDGLIDLAEYTAYYLGRVAEVPAARKDSVTAVTVKPADPFDAEDRPAVLRFGKLPKGLPAWFTDWDTDHDGQIGLYEWRTSGQTVDEFLKYDLNEDGFIEADECLKAAPANRTAPAPMVATAPARK